MDKTPRELETREAEARLAAWQPANSLPDPRPQPGKRFRYIRTSAGGQSDAINVARRLREGYVPVKACDHPELKLLSDKNSQFPDGIEIGGLLLCSTTDELARSRNDYYRTQTTAQMRAVDSQLMAEQDPRLRTIFRDVKSQTRFGPDARREAGAGTQLPTNK